MGDGGGADDLDVWLAPFLAVTGRKTRRAAHTATAGRRSTCAACSAPASARACSRWRHGWAYRGTISCSTSSQALPGTTPRCGRAARTTLRAQEADWLVGGPDAFLVIDDTALPKKGELSVGVARQYCGPSRRARDGARRPTANPWYRSPRRGTRCRSRRACGCSCLIGGPATRTVAPGRGCGSARCWPTPATA